MIRSKSRLLKKTCTAVAMLVAVGGCTVTDRDLYLAGDPGIAFFLNTLDVSLYLPGCAPYVMERSIGGKWVDLGPPFQCVWEGIAVEVEMHKFIETPLRAPDNSGTYRIIYLVSVGCEPGLPLSEAGCELENIPSIAEFKVERELCEPSEFACKFVPAAPNYLCEDGTSFGGPSGECTRNPSTGECGYEILSCP